MTEEARELELFIENDKNIYRQITFPLLKNYQKKWDKGTFNKEKAVKGMLHLSIYGAKKYVKEFCNKNCKYYHIFTPEDRKQVAESMVKYFINEVELGNTFK